MDEGEVLEDQASVTHLRQSLKDGGEEGGEIVHVGEAGGLGLREGGSVGFEGGGGVHDAGVVGEGVEEPLGPVQPPQRTRVQGGQDGQVRVEVAQPAKVLQFNILIIFVVKGSGERRLTFMILTNLAAAWSRCRASGCLMTTERTQKLIRLKCSVKATKLGAFASFCSRDHSSISDG